MPDNIAIKVDNISKTFRLPHEKNTSIKGAVINFYKRNKTYEKQQVLKNVSFEIKKGEFFGIVGRNGSGKSTLLKLLAGIYSPSQGNITVSGKLTPFIELGVGFNPELSGRENVFLNGALLGFSRKEMTVMYDDIVTFAELERFMDQKLKNYSTGMQVRLAFSIAIRVKSDILVLDEVLAVGDEEFQNKCLKIFEDLKSSKQTIVLVTHDMASVKRFCDKAIVIHDGEIAYSGDANEAANHYTRLNFPQASLDSKDDSVANEAKLRATITKLNDKPIGSEDLIKTGDKISIKVSWAKNPKIKNIGIALYSQAREYVFGTNTIIEKKKVGSKDLEYELKLDVGGGNYYLQVGAFGNSDTEKIYYRERALEFRVVSDERWQGLAYLEHEWKVQDV